MLFAKLTLEISGGKKMNKDKNNLLNKNQLTFLIIGFAIGPGFLRLVNDIIKSARQDAWIATIIALTYPIYILILANYIISKHPKENLLILNKKYFGCLLGFIFNSILLLQVIYYTCLITIDFSTVSRIYIVEFLTPSKVILVIIILCVYACNKGLKVLAQLSVLVSYMLILLILLSASALDYGSILNLQPIMSSSFKDILLGATKTTYFYTGFEFLLLYHPFAKDIKDIKKASIHSIIIVGLIWTWTAFITIYYLGIEIIPKSFYSFVLVFESIKIPLINNFRYVAMFIWALVSFKIISFYYFSSSYILNYLTKVTINKLNLLISPIIFLLSVNLIQMVFTNEQLLFLSNVFVILNITFLSILSLLVWIKSKAQS
jgi:spore germination protein